MGILEEAKMGDNAKMNWYEKCPKCGKEMELLDGGPDTYDDDITWSSGYCEACRYGYHGWDDKWIEDCDRWDLT